MVGFKSNGSHILITLAFYHANYWDPYTFVLLPVQSRHISRKLSFHLATSGIHQICSVSANFYSETHLGNL